MRSFICIGLIAAGCSSGPQNGYAVDLTIKAAPALSPFIVDSIHSLIVNVAGDETATESYPLNHPFHEERLIYSPRADSANLTIAVFADDAGNTAVAYGNTPVRLARGSTVTATVELGSDVPPPDMPIVDGMQSGDAGDLAAPNGDGPPPNADLTTSDMTPIQLLTITKSGAAAANGIVTTSGNEINCGSTCSASFAQGATITLTASVVPRTGTWFSGWSGDCAANNQSTCTVTLSQARNVTATFVNVNYVFVTSAATSLPLGTDGATSLTNADLACNNFAGNAHLPGHYRAWMAVLGNGTTQNPHVDAKDRLGSARGWVRTDDLAFVDSMTTALQSGSTVAHVLYPPELDETGHLASASPAVRTGTRADGTIQSGDLNCSDWSSTGGNSYDVQPGGGSTTWTTSGGVQDGCASIRFYCFGVDYTTTLDVPRPNARIAFVSKTTFTPSGALGNADLICQDEAMTAGLPGSSTANSYLALIATTSASAAARFDSSASTLPWARPDGVVLTDQAAGLFAAAPSLNAPLELQADGTTSSEAFGHTWTGAATMTGTGTSSTTCNNWASNVSAAMGLHGNVHVRDATFFADSIQDTCNNNYPVYCLQR